MEKRITVKEMFEKVLVAVEGNEELTSFIKGRIALIDKKAEKSADAKAEKSAINAKLTEVLTEVLAGTDEPMTVTAIAKSDDRLADYTNQKLTFVLTGMVDDGIAKRGKVKGVSVYSLA